jgi:hypothetical protein
MGTTGSTYTTYDITTGLLTRREQISKTEIERGLTELERVVRALDDGLGKKSEGTRVSSGVK